MLFATRSFALLVSVKLGTGLRAMSVLSKTMVVACIAALAVSAVSACRTWSEPTNTDTPTNNGVGLMAQNLKVTRSSLHTVAKGSEYEARVEGKMQNLSGKRITYVELRIEFINANGDLMGTSQVSESGIEPGQTHCCPK